MIYRSRTASTTSRKKKPAAAAAGMIRNPATGRMVKRTGAIGRRLLSSTGGREKKEKVKPGEPGVWHRSTALATRKSGGQTVDFWYSETAPTQAAAVRAVKRFMKERGIAVETVHDTTIHEKPPSGEAYYVAEVVDTDYMTYTSSARTAEAAERAATRKAEKGGFAVKGVYVEKEARPSKPSKSGKVVWYVAYSSGLRSNGAKVRSLYTATGKTKNAAENAVRRSVESEGLTAHNVYSEMKSRARRRPKPPKPAAPPAQTGLWADAAPGDKWVAVATVGRGRYHGLGKTRAKAYADLTQHMPPSVPPPPASGVQYEKR